MQRLAVVVVSFAASVGLLAQTPAAFEVASVKSNRTSALPTTLFPLGPGDAYAATGGLFRANNQPLIAYVRFAYRLGQGDLTDLPGWVHDERFDIQARTTGDATKDQMRLMMRSLLIERFKLAAHTEQRTQSIYDLTLAEAGRLGPQLRPHQTDDSCDPAVARPPSLFQLPTLPCGSIGFVTMGTGDRGRIVGNGEPMGKIAEVLRGPFTGIERHVRDRTGLDGTYDFSIEWSRVSDSVATASLLDDTGPGFQEALQKQLGLRLRSATGPVEVLIVDHLERPTDD